MSAPPTYTDTFENGATPGRRGDQIQWEGRTRHRKTSDPPADWRGRRVFVGFEGVRQVVSVYLNGWKPGVHKTGFTPFGFDLGPHLQMGGANVLALSVDNRFMKDPLDAQTAAEIAQRGGGSAAKAAPLTSAANPNLNKLHASINEGIPAKLEEPMARHERRVAPEGSVTLGSNTDGATGEANMYVVFVRAAR